MTVTYLVLCIFAGIASAWAMHLLMVAISRSQEVPVNMVRAIGSYGTGRVDARAARVGFFVHTLGGAFLGIVYGVILRLLGIEAHPVAFLAGSVMGFFHGLIVAYILMYFVAEHHPAPEYRKATMPVGAIHLAGHIFFGLAVVTVIFTAQGVVSLDDGTRADETPRELQLDHNPP